MSNNILNDKIFDGVKSSDVEGGVIKYKSQGGQGLIVSGYSDFILEVGYKMGTGGVLRIKASISDNVNFDEPATESNMWSYIQVINSATGNTSNGNAGIVIPNESSGVMSFELNINAMGKLSADFTPTSEIFEGSLTVVFAGTDNR